MKARIAKAADTTERREAQRIAVDLDARVRELGSEGTEARLVNVSQTGFMAESEGTFDVGAQVWLILPGRDRASATVRWTAGNRLGAEFAEPQSIEGFSNDR